MADAKNWGRILRRILRHRWLDEWDTRKAIPPEVVDRLMRRVAASEASPMKSTGKIAPATPSTAVSPPPSTPTRVPTSHAT